jgi:hypothetical protein
VPGDPLDTIRLAAEALAAHPDDQVRAIGAALADGIGAGQLIEHLTGQGGRRGHSVARELAYQRRNRALIAASQAWAALPVTDRARMTANALARYHGSSWQRDKCHAQCPHPEGSRRAHFWAALRAIDHAPGERQMQRIVGG